MKKYITPYLCILFLITIVGNAFGQKAISSFLQATGGIEKYQNINKFNLLLSSNENNISSSIEHIVDINEKKMIKIKSLMGKDFVYTFMNNQGRLKIPMGTRGKQSQFRTQSLSQNETQKLEAFISEQLFGFIDYKLKGFELLDETWSADSSSSMIRLKCKNTINEYYFDGKTGFLTKEIKNYTTGETEEYQYDEYKPTTYGIMFAGKITIVDGESKSSKTYKSDLIVNKSQVEDFEIYK